MNARRPPEPPDEVTNEDKAEALAALLRENALVRVFVLVTEAGVALPDRVVENAKTHGGSVVALHIGLNTSPPIPDLMVDDFGIRGTLSFNSTPFYVRLPWSAIGGAECPSNEPAKKRRNLVAVAKDLKFDARYQDFSLVPSVNPRVPPPLRIVRA